MTAIIGVDPGANGGWALIDGQRVELLVMPKAGKDIDWHAVAQWVEGVRPLQGPIIAYVEKTGARPGQGVSSMFRFGLNCGGVYGLLGAMGIPHVAITPQSWKRRVLEGTTKDKAAAIDYCRRRWPNVSLLATPRSRKPHDGLADALCIGQAGLLAEWRKTA